MFRIARHLLLAGFGFAAFTGQAHAQFNNPFKTPKIETPKFQAPKLPPVHLPPVHLPSPPPVKLPPVKVPDVKLPPVKVHPVKLPPAPDVHVPRLSDIKVPPVKLPPVPDVKLPTVKLPPVKLPPVKVPPLITLKPPQPTVFTDPPSTPGFGKKPNGGTQVGPQLGNSTPGIVIPPTQKPPGKPPVPGTKPNTNVTVVVVPTGLLGGFNGLGGGGGRPPVVVNPQPLVVPQPVVVNPEPVVVPQPAVTPEPVQTTGGTETPAAAGNANALRVKERFLDGAAAQAGIQLGDILIAAGGKRLKTVEDLESVSAMKVKLDVVYLDSTNNKLATCQLTGDGASFGVAVDPVAIDLEEEDQPAEMEQPIPEGTPTALQITEVTPRGPAARAGLQVGDVIVAIGGKRVETIEALNAALLRGIEVEVLFVNPDDGKADTRKLKVTADVGLAVKRIAVAEK